MNLPILRPMVIAFTVVGITLGISLWLGELFTPETFSPLVTVRTLYVNLF